MSLRFLLDTNIVSEPLRAQPSATLLARLRRHEGECAIASVVWHELRFGCARLPRSRRRTTIDRYLDDVVAPTLPILDYDARAAAWHAAERARLERKGAAPPFVDGQIAAIAAVQGLALVTSDAGHFRRFRSLKVIDWSDR